MNVIKWTETLVPVMTNSSIFMHASSFSEMVPFWSKTLVTVNKIKIFMLTYFKKYVF